MDIGSKIYNILDKILEKCITGQGTNYIKIGKFAICWGATTITLTSASSAPTKQVSLPITYKSNPFGICGFSSSIASSGAHVYANLTCAVYGTSKNSITLVLSQDTTAYTGSPGISWLTLGFVN